MLWWCWMWHRPLNYVFNTVYCHLTQANHVLLPFDETLSTHWISFTINMFKTNTLLHTAQFAMSNLFVNINYCFVGTQYLYIHVSGVGKCHKMKIVRFHLRIVVHLWFGVRVYGSSRVCYFLCRLLFSCSTITETIATLTV